MDLALESYDVCTELLQTKPKSSEATRYTIVLPNLRLDAAISVEEVAVAAAILRSCQITFSYSPFFSVPPSVLRQIEKRLKSLERCQSLEEIQRLFEAADFEAVVRLLQPTLGYGGGGGRSKPLEFVSSAPERPAQLMLLQVRGEKKKTHPPRFGIRRGSRFPPRNNGAVHTERERERVE